MDDLVGLGCLGHFPILGTKNTFAVKVLGPEQGLRQCLRYYKRQRFVFIKQLQWLKFVRFF